MSTSELSNSTGNHISSSAKEEAEAAKTKANEYFKGTQSLIPE